MKASKFQKFFQNFNKKNSRFFTLIEVLIVISIIAILSGIIIVNTASSRAFARNKKRISDLAAYQMALQEYYSRYKEYPIVAADCIAHEAGCLKVLKTEDFLVPLPEDPLSQDPDFHYRYTQNDDAFLGPGRGGSEYKLFVNLEGPSQTVEEQRDGGTEIALYEVFSTLGSRIAITYPIGGITQFLSCDLMSTAACANNNGVNVLRLRGETASVNFVRGAHSQLATQDFYETYYRKFHIISNSTATPLTDYQIRIKVHRAIGPDSGEDVYVDDKCQADFRDIRFYAPDEVTELPYWLEKIEGDTATFWLKVDSIPASGSTTIYISYGKERATTSNEANVFFSDSIEILTGQPLGTWGTGFSNPDDPYNTWYHDSRAESVYRVSELRAGGMSPVKITALKYLVYEQPGRPTLANFRIRIQHTNLADRSTGNFITSGYTTVYGPTSIARGSLVPGSWYTHTFSAPFYWNQEQNLLVDLTRDDTAYVSGGGMRVRTGLAQRTAGYYSDSARVWPFDGAPWFRRDWVPALRIDGLFRKYVSPEPSHGVWGGEESLTYELNYEYCICCFGPPDLGTDCDAPNHKTVLYSSGDTNAHVGKGLVEVTDTFTKPPTTGEAMISSKVELIVNPVQGQVHLELH